MRESIRQAPPLGRRSKNALYGAFTAVGILGGMFARDVIETAGTRADGASPVAPQGEEDTRPIEVEVHAVVEFPTPTVTPEPTATVAVTPRATKVPIDYCSTPAPGEACRVPAPTPLAPTPFPDCNLMSSEDAGAICIWPTSTPTGGERQ